MEKAKKDADVANPSTRSSSGGFPAGKALPGRKGRMLKKPRAMKRSRMKKKPGS